MKTSKFKLMDEYELYLEVWLDFYRKCEEFNKSINPTGGKPDWHQERLMNNHAGRLHDTFIETINVGDYRKWNRAKFEAERILRREHDNRNTDSRS